MLIWFLNDLSSPFQNIVFKTPKILTTLPMQKNYLSAGRMELFYVKIFYSNTPILKYINVFPALLCNVFLVHSEKCVFHVNFSRIVHVPMIPGVMYYPEGHLAIRKPNDKTIPLIQKMLIGTQLITEEFIFEIISLTIIVGK